MDQSRFLLFATVTWSIVGGLAGLILGMTFGFQGRELVFFVVLGLGIAWFGVSGLMGRWGAPHQADTLSDGSVKPEKAESSGELKGKGASSSVSDVKSDDPKSLSKEDARKWLDDFLLKQQNKK